MLDEAQAILERNQQRDPKRKYGAELVRQAALLGARALRQLGDAAGARARLQRVAWPRPNLEDSNEATPNNLLQWTEIELELGHAAEARPVFERIVARGWHLLPGNEEFVALARGAGLVP
jgi:hypothetical protein